METYARHYQYVMRMFLFVTKYNFLKFLLIEVTEAF